MTEELNRRHNLATTPTINNNGESYIVPFDIYKEGYDAYDISNWFKGRVGDNGTPFGIRWYKHGQLMDVTGMRPFIEGQVGDYTIDDSDPDDPKINMDSEASNVHVVGDVNDCQEYGVAIYRLINQAMPQSGIFYGKIGVMGTQDDGTTVMSSVDIVFKVLAGHMSMVGARKFYVSELEKALLDFKSKIKASEEDFQNTLDQHNQDFQKKTQQVIDDARNAYDSETKNAHDALNALDAQIQSNSNNETNLSRRLIGMQNQIDTKDIITRPEYEDQNVRIDKRLAEMNLNVETYHTLADVAQKYPTGSSNLIVTDDGYRAVWDGKNWVKGSAFVAAPLGNKAVAPTNVSNISYKQVLDNAIDFNSIRAWLQPSPSYVLKQDTSIDLKGTTGDNGLIIKIDASSLNDTFYINYKLNPLQNNNTQPFSIYQIKSNDQLGKELFKVMSNRYRSGSIECSKADFKDYIVDDTFYLLLAVHDENFFNVKVSVSNNRLSTNLEEVADKVNCPDRLSTTSLNAKDWNVWNASDDSYTLVNNPEGLYFKQNGLGDMGIYLQQKVNPTKDLYVTITTFSSNWFSCFLLKDFSQIPMPEAELTHQYSSTVSNDRYTTYVFRMSKSTMKKLEVDKEITLLLVTHYKDEFMQIKDISISNAPGSQFLTKKIDQLYSASGMNFSTQVGSIALLQSVANSSGVHYIAPKFVCDQDNQIITQINVFAKNKGTLNFAVGTIDQNQLLVNAKNYQFDVKTAGLQNLSTNIPINSGETLLLDISNGMADLYQPTEVNDEAYIQDDAHLSQNKGYSGKILYLAKYALPYEFYYQRKNLNDLLKNNSEQIEALKAENEDLKGQIKKRNIFRGNDNKFYKLQVINGKLSVDNVVPSNVVIIGNSLTSNTGLIGMNASDANHDYYHYVTEYIKSKNPNVQINPRTNVSSWESVDTTPPTADREKVFNDTIKPLLSADTDLVIIQLGDNVNNDVRMSTLLNDAKELLQEIKSVSPKAEIYWVYGWFGGYDQVQTPIQNACNAEGATGINIADLNTKDNQGTMGSTFTGLDGKTYTVTDPGVAAHPGDKGHKAIADRIINNFDF